MGKLDQESGGDRASPRHASPLDSGGTQDGKRKSAKRGRPRSSKVAAALADFDAMCDCLAPRELSRVIELLVELVEYDSEGGNVSITFRPSGIKVLAVELVERKEEAA